MGVEKPIEGTVISYLTLLYILCVDTFEKVERYFLNTLIPFLPNEHSEVGDMGKIKLPSFKEMVIFSTAKKAQKRKRLVKAPRNVPIPTNDIA